MIVYHSSLSDTKENLIDVLLKEIDKIETGKKAGERINKRARIALREQ